MWLSSTPLSPNSPPNLQAVRQRCSKDRIHVVVKGSCWERGWDTTRHCRSSEVQYSIIFDRISQVEPPPPLPLPLGLTIIYTFSVFKNYNFLSIVRLVFINSLKLYNTKKTILYCTLHERCTYNMVICFVFKCVLRSFDCFAVRSSSVHEGENYNFWEISLFLDKYYTVKWAINKIDRRDRNLFDLSQLL